MVRRFDLDLAASRVARAGGEPVGIALLGLRGDRGWIGGMGVVPGARREGLGRRLMAAVIEQARSRARLRSVRPRGAGAERRRDRALPRARLPLVAHARRVGARHAAARRQERARSPRPRRAPGSRRGARRPSRGSARTPRSTASTCPRHPLRGLEVTADGKRTGRRRGAGHAGPRLAAAVGRRAAPIPPLPRARCAPLLPRGRRCCASSTCRAIIPPRRCSPGQAARSRRASSR